MAGNAAGGRSCGWLPEISMPGYIAFLRGVSPMNARMADLKRCFEAAGFSEVRTVLSSGNVVFHARSASLTALQQRAEIAMQAGLGRSFGTFIRPVRYLQELIDADPFGQSDPSAKRVVTFLRAPASPDITLPIARDGACILGTRATEVFSVYVPDPKRGPLFMALLERTFGKDITTRTLDTVVKCTRA
jgi:uncharacterized protein (DUF1697 family)